jgi:hypothetical protein
VTDPQTRVQIAQNFAIDSSMLWKDLFANFLIDGFLSTFVTHDWWAVFFLKGASPYRTNVFTFEGLGDRQRDYILWLLKTCAPAASPTDLVDETAIDLLAARLRTPLQIGQHLTLAFEEVFRVGENPASIDIIEAVLSRQIDDLERLMRHGYDVRALVEQFHSKPAEIKMFLNGTLDVTCPTRCWLPDFRNEPSHRM